MNKTLKVILFLIVFFSPLQLFGETLYFWTDPKGKLHITKKAPPDDSQIVDVMEYEPQPVDDTAPVATETNKRQKDSLREEKCRLAAEARRIARDARVVAEAAASRAAKKRAQSQDLKSRVGYDDELIDDYGDEIRELENAARQAELFARQAQVQARKAFLQARRAEIEAGPDCRF